MNNLSNAPTSALLESMAADRRGVIEILLSRQSCWPLVEPGPNNAELDLIFDAALRAPDHGRLRPWRFTLIRGEARAELGDVLVDIAADRTPDEPRSAHEHRRQKAYAAPIIIVLAAAIDTASNVPESEQLLSVGAAAMNMLNVIHALGYGGFWVTGEDAYDAQLQAALDIEPNECMAGFLFVGSPKSDLLPSLRPSRAHHVREWIGRSSV